MTLTNKQLLDMSEKVGSGMMIFLKVMTAAAVKEARQYADDDDVVGRAVSSVVTTGMINAVGQFVCATHGVTDEGSIVAAAERIGYAVQQTCEIRGSHVDVLDVDKMRDHSDEPWGDVYGT